MSKKWMIITSVVVLIIIGVSAAYVMFAPSAQLPSIDQRDASSPAPSASPEQTPENAPATATDLPAVKGSYVTYTGVDQLQGNSGTKLLFFHAPWCPQCRALEKDIQATSLPDNLTIYKVDYDTNQSLRQKYGVTIQTTLVKVDSIGNQIEKYVAYDQPTFEAVRQNLLD